MSRSTDQKIIAVGGIFDEQGNEQLGNDPLRIADAIRRHWSRDGVLLLVDLGSAVLGVETALDLLEPEQRSACLISNAPLVEGAVVAAVEAGLGHALHEVNQAAEAIRFLDKVAREEQPFGRND